MKNRKQKLTQPRKILINLQEQQNNLSIYKSSMHLTGHTKESTNCTIHSLAASNNKICKPKGKKNIHSSSKECPLETNKGLATSKSTKRFKKIEITLKNLPNNKNESAQSYRQYCLIDQNFVPIFKGDDQQMIHQFLAKTATSSCDFNDLKEVEKPILKQNRINLRKRSINNSNKTLKEEKPTKEDKATSNLYNNIAFQTAEVQASLQCNQIGIQYSERKSIVEEISQPKIISKKHQSESLSNLLQRLQQTHFDENENSFTVLTSNEKQHYSHLLETLAIKLKPSVKNPFKIVNPISFDVCEQEVDNSQYFSESFQKCGKQLHQLSVRPNLINYENLQRLIIMREYKQMNWIENPNKYEDVTTVDTSLIAVINFLCHLFCYIEVQYSEQFVEMIMKRYGLTFRQKYRRISKNMALNDYQHINVVDESIFLDFINQNEGQYNAEEIIHFKAIFDAFNEHLEQYRPFYSCNGEQFPWSFKMFATMSQYSIDQDSLHIIFRQAKDKMIEWVSNLCGLLVQHQQKVMLPKNPLQIRLAEKQNVLVTSSVRSQNFYKDEIQLFSTQALHEISQIIYQELIDEFARENALKFI